MTKINDPDNLGSDLFGYAMKYNNPEDTSLSLGRFNGNIAEIDWRTSTVANDNKRRYSFTYDCFNRLQQGIYSEPGSSVINNNNYNEQLTYDLNGNILTLKRFSKPYSGTTPELIDDLVYNYTGNRLDKITLPSGTVNNASGYNALENTITYNANGSMINQWDKNIASIDYDHLNLPRLFTTGSGKFKQTIAYNYRADGVKIGKNTAGRFFLSTNTDYLDGFQYQVSLVGDGQDSSNFLQFFPTSEGYFDFQQNRYIYNYTDHLGNVHLSYFNNGSSTEVLEENNYYPFGLKHGGYNELGGNPAYQYKYNGKELQTETGMYDYGARFYMPDLGRWGVVDPLAETSRRWSSYTYAYNNPIRFIDPDGMENKDIHLLGNLADKALEQLNANSSLAITKDSNGKLDTAKLSKSEYNKLSATDKALYDGIKNTSIDSRIYAESNNITPSGGLMPGGSFGGADYDSATGISTGTQYTNPDILGNAESFTGTQKGTGIIHEVVENVLITQESLNTKTDVPIKTELNPSPIFDKFHDQTRSMMPYDNLVISARTRFETVGTTTRKYYEGFAGKKDVNGKIQTQPLYKVYSDDKRLKK